MNRMNWEKQVFASNLSTTARLVALVVGSFGNWTDDRTVWPSTSTIAEATGMTRDTVQKYIDEFAAQGWLEVVGTKNRVTEYALTTPPVADSIGILARTKRAMNPKSTANLRVGRDKAVADTTGPVADTTGRAVADTTGKVPDTFGTNIKNLKKEPTREHKRGTTVADAPVVDSFPNYKLEEGLEEVNYLTLLNRGERDDLERRASTRGATKQELNEAAMLLHSNEVHGDDWQDKVTKALTKVGVLKESENEEW